MCYNYTVHLIQVKFLSKQVRDMSVPLFIGVWLAISAIPYAMYLIAWLFESRKPGNGPNDIPVWRDQSKAFLPGDFGLALVAASGIMLAREGLPGWATSWWWLSVSVLVGLVVFWVGRRVLYSVDDYTPEAWRSPSKRWHDFVMFFGFTVAMAAFILPAFIAHGSELDGEPASVAMLGGLLWVLGIAWDTVIEQVPNKRQHPSVYKPLWRK